MSWASGDGKRDSASNGAWLGESACEGVCVCAHSQLSYVASMRTMVGAPPRFPLSSVGRCTLLWWETAIHTHTSLNAIALCHKGADY